MHYLSRLLVTGMLLFSPSLYAQSYPYIIRVLGTSQIVKFDYTPPYYMTTDISDKLTAMAGAKDGTATLVRTPEGIQVKGSFGPVTNRTTLLTVLDSADTNNDHIITVAEGEAVFEEYLQNYALPQDTAKTVR